MAEKQIQQIMEKVKREYGVDDVRVVHRIGWLEVGEAAVAITVSAPHRQEAFSACRQVMDQIKKRIPIWKKEVYADGTGEWVMGDCVSGEAR